MAREKVDEQIIEQIARLNLEQKQRLLNYARTLASPVELHGTPGKIFAASALAAGFDPDDLREIGQTIEESCERIDLDTWQ